MPHIVPGIPYAPLIMDWLDELRRTATSPSALRCVLHRREIEYNAERLNCNFEFAELTWRARPINATLLAVATYQF